MSLTPTTTSRPVKRMSAIVTSPSSSIASEISAAMSNSATVGTGLRSGHYRSLSADEFTGYPSQLATTAAKAVHLPDDHYTHFQDTYGRYADGSNAENRASDDDDTNDRGMSGRVSHEPFISSHLRAMQPMSLHQHHQMHQLSKSKRHGKLPHELGQEPLPTTRHLRATTDGISDGQWTTDPAHDDNDDDRRSSPKINVMLPPSSASVKFDSHSSSSNTMRRATVHMSTALTAAPAADPRSSPTDTGLASRRNTITAMASSDPKTSLPAASANSIREGSISSSRKKSFEWMNLSKLFALKKGGTASNSSISVSVTNPRHEAAKPATPSIMTASLITLDTPADDMASRNGSSDHEQRRQSVDHRLSASRPFHVTAQPLSEPHIPPRSDSARQSVSSAPSLLVAATSTRQDTGNTAYALPASLTRAESDHTMYQRDSRSSSSNPSSSIASPVPPPRLYTHQPTFASRSQLGTLPSTAATAMQHMGFQTGLPSSLASISPSTTASDRSPPETPVHGKPRRKISNDSQALQAVRRRLRDLYSSEDDLARLAAHSTTSVSRNTSHVSVSMDDQFDAHLAMIADALSSLSVSRQASSTSIASSAAGDTPARRAMDKLDMLMDTIRSEMQHHNAIAAGSF
ncbi:hypothetical protein BC831DRAFT_458487 [Entophlyctis helioformis]|nr:hypothetical protein BC831DRAFT_458487 [Entophlyctis helioformis]